jgi:TPR repeat protein
VAQNYAKAREWYEKAAAEGEADAMVSLGELYENGQGVARDYAKASENYAKARGLYEKAARKGDARAMHGLGGLYESGQGVERDYAKARDWYEKAADKGDTLAMTSLGALYINGQGVERDYAKARDWYEKAAGEGEALAMTSLGWLYINGGPGVARDYAKAHEWYKKAANKSDASAMTALGLLYSLGQGVERDYAKAREWYEKAAHEGVAGAMINLGVFYENGQGVERDYAKAREWYEKAADKGDESDKARLKAHIEQLSIMELAKAGRYAEALQLQEPSAVKVEEVETEREGKPGVETAQALKGLAWYALLSREFTKALVAADRAHALLPDDREFEINRAHALMFLERREESKALYLAYKGKPVSDEDDRLWERVIVEDFAEFRKAGLTHPMMADIEKELGVSPDHR